MTMRQKLSNCNINQHKAFKTRSSVDLLGLRTCFELGGTAAGQLESAKVVENRQLYKLDIASLSRI